MSAIVPERLADVFVELADTLVDDFDLVEFLQMVTARASELTGAHAVGLMLADADDRLHFMAASDERVHLLDLFQIQADEGPCRDCFRQGVPVSEPDLRRASTRWPRFAFAAQKAGFASVQAFPLRLRQQVIGSVGLFGASAVAMTPADTRVVQALADVATIGILQEREVRRGQVLAEQLQGALNSRIVVEQAKGVIAQARGATIDQAFALLRKHCRANYLRLSDVARSIVSDPDQVQDLPDLQTG